MNIFLFMFRLFSSNNQDLPEQIMIQALQGILDEVQGEQNTGLSEQHINQLRSQAYDYNEENSDISEVCSVCLEQIRTSQRVINLECNHKFHEVCILRWFANHNTCPVCRQTAHTTHATTSGTTRNYGVNRIIIQASTIRLRVHLGPEMILDTYWNTQNTPLELIKYIMRLDPRERMIMLNIDDKIFKSTESLSFLNLTWVQHGIRQNHNVYVTFF